jgi:integrase
MSRRANGQGTIYHRSDGRWEAVINPFGSKRSIYGRTKQEVASKLNAALNKQEAGLPPADSSQTMAQFLTNWLQSVEASVRPTTYRAYDLNVRRVLPHFGTRRLKSLTPQLIESTYSQLLAGGLSRRSVEQGHAVLHRALRQAVQWGLLGRNPTDAVNVPRPEKREMKTLTQDQVTVLLESTKSDRLFALWVLLVTTGVRVGEALGLKWEDVDLDAARARIQRSMQRQSGGGLVFVEPKTARSRRTISLPHIAVTALQEHRGIQLGERVRAESWIDQDLVFCRPDGRGIESSTVPYHFHRALQRAELPRVRVHDLRHTAATLLLSGGVHPKVVQDMLGHSTVMLTLDTYSHVSPNMHAEAAAKMDTLLGNG